MALVAIIVFAVLLRRKPPPVPASRPRDAGVILTRRERDVLKLLMDGKGDKQIAFRLGISTQTVKHYQMDIRDKYRVDTRSEMIVFSLSNRKGRPCFFRDLLCQEGYCRGCQIFIDHKVTYSGAHRN
jgi:DNA-binding CsgD family transcriptional regulator